MPLTDFRVLYLKINLALICYIPKLLETQMFKITYNTLTMLLSQYLHLMTY